MTLIIPPRALRLVRGIRDSIPPDSVIGRSGGSSDGPAHVISLRDLAKGMVSGGFVSAPSNLSEQLDALFGSSEGSLIQRGPSVWQGLSPGTAHQILNSGGASALNAWISASAWLDAVIGSSAGMIAVRGSSVWGALTRGTAGQFAHINVTTNAVEWFDLFHGAPGGGNLVKFNDPFSLTNTNLTGDVTTSGGSATTLAASGVTAATYGDSTHVPQIVVDAKGRITSASNVAVTASPSSISLTDGHILVGNGSNVAADVAMSGDVTIADTGAATIKSSVALAGNPTTTTQSASDNSTRIATTAFVTTAVSTSAAPGAAAQVGTTEGTTSTTYTDLATVGPAVTFTTGTSVLVWFTSGAAKPSAGGNTAFVSVAVSGSTTVSAADGNCGQASPPAAAFNFDIAGMAVLTGLTAGSNTFTLKYRLDGGATVNFFNRRLAILRLN